MVFKRVSKGEQPKARVSTKTRNDKQGKPATKVLDDTRSKSNDKRVKPDDSVSFGNYKVVEKKEKPSAAKKSVEVESKVEKKVVFEIDPYKEPEKKPSESTTNQMKKLDELIEISADDDPNAFLKLDSIEFKNGKNTLSIRFSKKHNRMYKVQVFLNEKHEVRPTTHNGYGIAHSFWEMLKDNLKS